MRSEVSSEILPRVQLVHPLLLAIRAWGQSLECRFGNRPLHMQWLGVVRARKQRHLCSLQLPDGLASMLARDACSALGVSASSTMTIWFPDTETSTPPSRQKERRMSVRLDTIGLFSRMLWILKALFTSGFARLWFLFVTAQQHQRSA